MKLALNIEIFVLLCASPLGNGGRGLKPSLPVVCSITVWHRPSATGGVD